MATKKPSSKLTVANRGEKVALVTQALSGLMGRMRMLSKAGLQYEGKRDVYSVAGYVPQGKDDFDHYWGLYERGDIAGRIVDMPAQTTWRTPPTVYEEDHEKGTPFTDAVEALADRLRLWRYFERVDRLAGVGEYAILVLGCRGVDDLGLKTPLVSLSRPEDLIWLGVYSQRNATISTWITDTGDPRFGQPELYQVQLSSGVSNFGKASLQIHQSRIIHVAEDLLQDEVYGRPRLQRALNRLFDLDKITASVGESFWQAATRILQSKISPDATITDDQLKEMDEKLTEMVHDLRRQFSGQGVELGWLDNTVPTVKDIADLYFALIAAATGIPRRILFGNEAGDLASSTDQATYFGLINERQEHFAEPNILRAFLDRLITVGALPKPTTGKYEIEWPTLFELTELEQSDANLKRAQTAQALTAVGADPLALVEIDEDRNVWLVPRQPPTEERPLMDLPDPNAPQPGAGTPDNPQPGDGGNQPGVAQDQPAQDPGTEGQ